MIFIVKVIIGFAKQTILFFSKLHTQVLEEFNIYRSRMEINT